MSVPIRTRQTLHDPVRRAHRRAAVLRIVLWVILGVFVSGGVGWGGWYWWNHRPIVTTRVPERTPAGVWCVMKKCQYFDASGAFWGPAIFSRGPLFLLVEDERVMASASSELAQRILVAVNGLPDLGMRAQFVTLPDSAPGDMRITVDKSYAILMDVQGDIADQLATLATLLAEKAKDTAWAPTSIDLRTPGRVYYR